MNSEENKILNTKITTSLLIKIVIGAVAVLGFVFSASSKYSSIEGRLETVEKEHIEIKSELNGISKLDTKVEKILTEIDWIKKNIK